MPVKHEVVVVDPAVASPELDCFNLIARLSELPATYHLPAMWGMASLKQGSLARKPAAVIILGSRASVHDALEWQDELRSWVKGCIDTQTPILGLCYGHQLLAHLFGAEVAHHPSGEKLVGLRRVQLQADERLLLPQACSGSLVVSHREVVVSRPAGMRVFGQSADVGYDAFCHESLPIWTFQAHPEATAQFCRNQSLPIATDDDLPFSFGWNLVQRFLAYSAASC